jgi:hypothetical protein
MKIKSMHFTFTASSHGNNKLLISAKVVSFSKDFINLVSTSSQRLKMPASVNEVPQLLTPVYYNDS